MSGIQVGIISLMVIMSLMAAGVGIYMLILMWREQGPVHAIIGFFVSPYPYVWGWINAKRLEIMDIMIFWTAVTVIGIAFFSITTAQTAAQFASALEANGPLSVDVDSAAAMGSISVGGRTEGWLSDPFDEQAWTFNGASNQTISINCNATNGDATDPEITLLGPGGEYLGYDDDSGGNSNASLSFSLPAEGQYTIVVGSWGTGGYELILN